MTKGKDTKIDESKLEGLKVIGGKGSYNPATEKEIVEEIVFTSPVKIGDEEYIVEPLDMWEVKQITIEQKKVKPGDIEASYDFTFFAMLTVLKKFNPDKAKDLTVEGLMKKVTAPIFEEVLAAISQISGLKKLFKLGDTKQ